MYRPSLLLAAAGVEHGLRDLPHAVQGDPRALFNGEGMVGGLQFDVGALANRAGVDVGLEIERRGRIDQQISGQPAEVRLLGLAAERVPQVRRAGEVLAAERDPDPQENTSSLSTIGISIMPFTK
ncbi:hypothetical protein GCM10017668_00400 [Streptomyces tuirus]|uniref:Uncharacterized protein n=1 Tax=Streptomyces tuirus TaxID=68278 RepID=A0A7G1N8R1_9ACTN|nr:hypothetical protein GCM10017668_00400 [Streptomyces tuirus]